MGKRSKRIELFDDGKIKLVNPTTLQFFKRYEIDMSIRELSPATIYNYTTDLNQWFIYIYENQGNIGLDIITSDDIEEFIYFCKLQGNGTARLKRRMSSISAFYEFLRKKKLIKENPMEYIDRPKKDVKVVEQTYLTQEQVDAMKAKLKELGDLQLELYVCLSLSTMARVNAIASIKWEQISFVLRIIDDVLEKEQRYVTLYFNEECKELLSQLQEERKALGIECEYVFISKYKNVYSGVSNVTLANWTRKAGMLIGVETLHPHDFRHSKATLLKNAGMPLESVSSLLQHKSTDVTLKHYIKEDPKAIQEMKDMFDK